MGLLLKRAALALTVAGVLLPHGAPAQQPTGSLTGRLTDPHSSPLENVTLRLRNETTGAEITAVSSRGGRYRFTNLAEGDYTLDAPSAGASSRLEGIKVSALHESHVQAVIDLAGADSANKGVQVFIPAPAPEEKTAETLNLLNVVAKPSPLPVILIPPAESMIASVQLDSLPAVAHPFRPALIAPANVLVSALPIRLLAAPHLDLLQMAGLDDSLLSVTPPPSLEQLRIARLTKYEGSSDTLNSAQLASLPLPGRDWSAFFDGAQSSTRDRQIPETTELQSAPLSLDGHDLRSAFGHLRASGINRFSETAIGLVRPDETAHIDSAPSGRGLVSLESQRGTDHIHGQLFLFKRQHLLGAQNPSTTWVKEAAPQSGPSVPVFTPQPYSPSDLELRWGVGAGSVFRRSHLFWFGALDGFQRNYPAVSSVRHPDRFFAQPANDQMQLLSAQLGLSSNDPVAEGLSVYSKLLESLAALLGPAPRSSQQLNAFARFDLNAGERHSFTVEAIGTHLDAPGAASTRAWQTYGTHSLGSLNSTNLWLLGRWQTFVTPNLLATAQGSIGREVQSTQAEPPSAFEQSLNISAWGQLPQIVVDSRDGFTIGNPARFGRGRYPDESIYSAQQQLKWVHGNLLWSSGLDLHHERDATRRLRNQTGTYYYSTIGDFASDALAFFSFGLNGQLNPMDQHNCDQRGRPWRDSTGVLHGLGYLPCYSYYSQTIGPSDWWIATNDWAGHSTLQWQASKRTVLTLAARWELQQLPGPINKLDNPDLPLTGHLPALGSQWAPRAGFAWGSGETRWPVLRLGYGMYFGRTPNAMIETVLTHTGSPNGDVDLFMRPTDNLYGGGAPPFPYVLAGLPGTFAKPQAVEFAPSFRNGEVHQAELSVEETLPGRIHLDVAAAASLGRRLPVTLDANIDPAANPGTITYLVVDGSGSGPIKTPQITVPFFASWPSTSSITGFGGRQHQDYQQISELFSRANSTYEALLVRLSRSARGLTFRGRYAFAHAADWNPDESTQTDGPSLLDPTDFHQEYGTSDLDVRHSATTAIILQPKWKLGNSAGYVANGWMLSAVGQFHSGLPYSMRTAGSMPKEFDVNGRAIVALGTGMNGYGGDNRVYGVGRNTFRYPATWKADLRLSKKFNLGQMRQLELMAESFNLFNHQNVTEVETVGYSIEQGTMNGAMPRLSYLTGLKSGQTEFGKPLNVNATDRYRERQVQFGAHMHF